MHNKKLVTTISAIAVVLFIVVFYFAAQKISEVKEERAQESAKISQSEELSSVLPQVKCEPVSDEENYKKAIDSQDVSACECIKDEKLKGTCKYATVDLSFYSQAIAQLDLDMCEKVSNQSRRSSCIKVVESGAEYLSEEDPQYLANIHSISHNESAISELEKLLEGDPDNVANLILLSLAYSEKGLKEQEQGRSQDLYVNKAIETILKAEKIDPSNSEVHRAKGYAYEIKPDINMAIAMYDKAIELDPNNPMAYAGRGHAESIVGVLDGALEDFRKAANLDTENEIVFIYANLCRLESSRDDLLSSAIKNCSIVANSDFNDPVFKSEASQLLARAYIKNSNYSQASNYLLKAKTLTPKDPNVYVGFSDLSFFEEDYVESQIHAEKSIELSPTKAGAYLALAKALYMQDGFNGAIESINIGIDLVSEDVSLLGPQKDAMSRDMYYVIAHSYKRLGDDVSYENYMGMANEIFGESN